LNRSNGSTRQQRTERSVACVQLARACLKYLDLVTLRVGIPSSQGTIQNLTLPFLARQAGLQLRRAERALRDLQAAGVITLKSRCERGEAGDYKGVAAIKSVSAALFGAFGLTKWLAHERSKATLRRQRKTAAEAKQERKTTREHARGKLWLKGMQNAMRKGPKPSTPNCPEARGETGNSEFERQVQIRAGQIKLGDPSLDRDTCYRLARQQLAPPPH
jgi:hypothetical protein